jgi:two-component system CheB/CheR fusion protein
VLREFAPVGVVINNDLEVVQFRGRTSPYLEPAPGKASLNVSKLARNGLGIELRTLINAARKKGSTARKDGVVFDADARKRVLTLSVSPLGEQTSSANGRHFLILFEDVTPAGVSASEGTARRGKESSGSKQSARLKRELTDAQSALSVAMESEDALREEFQSANEEILSANEELQSTNEELETSKEELQSANEELNTLNDELRNKNGELQVLNNDLFNFLNSTQIPIVMLDRRSRIRRLTPHSNRLLNVVPTDIGRPISDIRLNIKIPDLEAAITQTLDSLQPQQRDVQDLENRWYSLHILPYRTEDDKIDGTVLVLQDIDVVRSANEQLRKSSEFFRGIINTVREPLLVLDSDLRVIAANEPYLSTFKVSLAETVDKFFYRVSNEQWNMPRLRMLLEQVLPQQQVVMNFEVDHTFERIGHKTMLVNARTLVQSDKQQPMILLAIQDVTERKLAEIALIRSEKLAAAGHLASSLAHEINNPLQAVTNLMTLLEGSAGLDEENRRYATLAKHELGRVIHLVRQSLGFCRETVSPTTVNLQEVLESVIDLYKPKLDEKQVALTKEYLADAGIKSYPGEIRQVFSTLLHNAMDACNKGCRITLRARIACDWKRPEVRGVRITLADSGGGIPEDKKAHIFEPFFTTKGERGTGLGLWVTNGVVQRLRGSIHMRSRSEPGKSGTCFSIFLPEQEPETT